MTISTATDTFLSVGNCDNNYRATVAPAETMAISAAGCSRGLTLQVVSNVDASLTGCYGIERTRLATCNSSSNAAHSLLVTGVTDCFSFPPSNSGDSFQRTGGTGAVGASRYSPTASTVTIPKPNQQQESE